jgi:site-specific DNA-methyltransferase (adenine-specific)
MIDLYTEDNLDLLSRMQKDVIDLIYCDILFNTGKKFKDYDDNLGSLRNVYTFYAPRFVQMKRVLKDTGTIYIHCDWHIAHTIRATLDDIFGLENFRNEIIWEYNSAPRKKKDFGKRHDIIFRYSKTDDYYFNEDSTYIREPYALSAPRGYEKEKYYDKRGKVLGDVWKIPMLGQNDKTERVDYDTQKPTKLLLPIIDSSCPLDGIVADFFLGSGTTAVVCKMLKRDFVGCDINEKSIRITNERLSKLL